MFRSIGFPFWTTTSGEASSTLRAARNRNVSQDVPTARRAKVPDGEAGPRQGHVALRHALLDEVADDHEQDQVERLERGELPPARAGARSRRMKA